MERKKIIFVHTTGSWWDHRYYFKQMPALHKEYADVTYLIKEDKTIEDCPFDLVTISSKKLKWARLTGGLNLFFYLLKIKQDAIQLCNIELLPVGILLGLLSRKKIFYDCREDHYHAMLHGKVWFPKWFRYILGFGVKTLEFMASKTFTGFIDSDPAIYKFHNFMPKRKKMIFYNMALKSQFNDSKIDRNIKRFDFTVLGSMSVRTGVLDVVKAVSLLQQQGKDVRLKLIGDPSIDKTLYKQINDVIKRQNIKDKVTITGKVPYFQIPFMLADCKIGVIPLLNIPKFQNNIATKQFEYMASAMPVIATDLPPQNLFIKDNFNGFHYKPGNIDELMNRMNYYLDKEPEILRMSKNALEKINNDWNAESQQEKFIAFYKLRMKDKPYKELQIPPFDF